MTTYRIVPKRDFGSGKGFWLPGVPGGKGTDSYGFVKSGFVVTDGFCNRHARCHMVPHCCGRDESY